MIVLLRELFENKSDVLYVNYIKEQMIQLYSQLSTCEMLPSNIFLWIIRSQNIFVDIDEQLTIRGAITALLEKKVIHKGGIVCHIEDLVVHKDHRGQQIGSELVDHVVNYAKEKGCYKTILNCNDQVEPFYQKLGFQSKNKEMSLYF